MEIFISFLRRVLSILTGEPSITTRPLDMDPHAPSTDDADKVSPPSHSETPAHGLPRKYNAYTKPEHYGPNVTSISELRERRRRKELECPPGKSWHKKC